MTKKELEEQVKALRAKLDETQLELDQFKSEKKELGVLDEVGVGGFFNDARKQWTLVELAFNKETGEAKVTGQKEVGADIAMFQYHVNQFVAEHIHLKNLRR